MKTRTTPTTAAAVAAGALIGWPAPGWLVRNVRAQERAAKDRAEADAVPVTADNFRRPETDVYSATPVEQSGAPVGSTTITPARK